jgi:hypothetical protein
MGFPVGVQEQVRAERAAAALPFKQRRVLRSSGGWLLPRRWLQ